MKAYTKPNGKVKVTFRQMWDIAKQGKQEMVYCYAPYPMCEDEFFSQNSPNVFFWLDSIPTWDQLKEVITFGRKSLLRFFYGVK